MLVLSKMIITKRILCIFICLLIVFTAIFCQPRIAHANPVVLVPLVEASPYIAAMAVAAGIQFKDNASVSNFCSGVWDAMPTDLKAKMSITILSVKVAGTKIADVADDVWTGFKSLIGGFFSSGSARTITLTGESINFSNISAPLNSTYARSASDISKLILAGKDLMYADGSGYRIFSSAGASNFYWQKADGSLQYMRNFDDVGNTAQFYLVQSTIAENFEIHIVIQQPFVDYLVNGGSIPKSYYSTNSSSNTVNYTGESILDNPSYDFKTAEGTRSVSYPDNISDLVGKTHTDVQNKPLATQPTVLDYPSTWTGKFTDASPVVASKHWTYPTTFKMTDVGVWEGQWTDTAEREREFVGTVTISGVRTQTMTITEELTDEATDEETDDYSKPLPPTIANIFTTRFPFSLPWDVKRTFEAIFIDSPEPPKWDIKWHDPILGTDFGFTIDLKQFDTMFKIVRVFVLIGLIMGTIFGTRKLLGGAT